MNIIIWGIGKFYANHKKELENYHEINTVALCDNNKELWGKQIDGVYVISPETIKEFTYDAILIMSVSVIEINSQLLKLGVDQKKILFWEAFYAKMLQGKREIFISKTIKKNTNKRVLIISTHLEYNGGTIASVYAAKAIQQRGYDVVLMAPSGNNQFIEETVNEGITITICPALPYIYEKEQEWIGQFDVVIVNVLQMMNSAYGCASIRPTIWWIHEPSDVYRQIMSYPWNCVEQNKLDKLNIYAVSNIAKENYNALFANRIKELLPYGIPDIAQEKDYIVNHNSKIVFAIIGVVCERKAQDVFVEAIRLLKHIRQAEFWIIGSQSDSLFNNHIKEMARDIPSIKLKGVLTRDEIYRVFPQIDVVVCASREDPLPIVMTEGMMFGKVCITTDKTGTASYIQNGINGFVIPANNVEVLKEQMEWIINNQDCLKEIGENARKTYEKYFTMDIFADSLERILQKTENKFKQIRYINDCTGDINSMVNGGNGIDT